MPQPAIRVENLSKLYRIGTRQNGAYRTLRETITDAVADPFRRLFGRNGAKSEEQRVTGKRINPQSSILNPRLLPALSSPLLAFRFPSPALRPPP